MPADAENSSPSVLPEENLADDEFSEDEIAREAGEGFARLAASPEDVELFFETVRLYLSREITPATYPEMSDALRFYVPQSSIAVLLAIVNERPTQRDEALVSYAWPADARAVARRLIALFGEELMHAWNIWPRSRRADDWMHVTVDVAAHRTRTEEEVMVRVAIIKRNRQTLVIEGGPQSIARLSERIVRGLDLVEDIDEIDPKIVRNLAEAARRLEERLPN